MADPPADHPLLIAVTVQVAEDYGGRILALAPGARLVRLLPDGSWDPPDVDPLDVFFLSEDLYTQREAIAAAMARFSERPPRWFHSSSAGIDHPVFGTVVERGATLTHSPGALGGPIAEYVLGAMLRHVKHMRAHAANQAARVWEAIPNEELAGATVGIVGYGGIGLEVARRARAFEMRVLALRRRPVEDPLVDAYYPPARLHDMLGDADFVVLATPLTAATRGLIDAAALAAMRPTALLINVARGGVLDEPALIEALQQGRIGGAALDVAATEPLPPESPLWSLENCAITPHDSAIVPSSFTRTSEVFLRNLARFVRGEALEHVAAEDQLAPAVDA